MRTTAMSFLVGDEGSTAIEYGLIASLVAIAMLAGATALSRAVNDLYTNIASHL